MSIVRAPVGFDSACYLASARDVSQGLVPFRDFLSMYTPLGFYLFALPILIGRHPDHRVLLLFETAIVAVNAVLCGRLWLRLGARPRTVLFYGVVLFILGFSLLDNSLLLEPFSISFGAAGMLVMAGAGARHWRIGVFSGMLVGLSFLSKQYGLLFAAPVAALAWTSPSGGRGWRLRAAGAALGFVAAAASFVGLLWAAAGTPPQVVLSGSVPLWYAGASDSAARISVWRQISFWQWLIAGKVFLMSVAAAAAAVLSRGGRFRSHFRENRRAYCVAGLGLAAALTPSLIRPYEHYYLYSVPFVLWLAALSLDEESIGGGGFALGASAAMVLIVLVLMALRSNRYAYKVREEREEARAVGRWIPPGAPVYMTSHWHLYYTAKLANGVPQFGYEEHFSFHDDLPELLDRRRSRAQYLIVSPRELDAEGARRNRIDREFETVGGFDDIVVLRRRP
jgi:MFS family permease